MEERKTAKDAEVDAGLALEAVLIGHCGIAILVHYVLGRADINDVDSIGMGIMMKKSAKSCVVEENIGSVVDFTPFDFAYTVHFMMVRSRSFNFISM